ncbi:cupin-like domain-containing protein [Sorangium sp. So ce1024]|uniref:cupin-like domain-containing protein n=1 Tax=unclassified Sorangium TaxID=2621164 RepID=UPI003F0CED0D
MTADKVGRIRLRDHLRSLDETALYGDQLDASDFPGISDHHEVPAYVPMPRQLTIALCIGPSGTISHFHKDYHYEVPFLRNENCFVQICGKKQFVLVPPEYDDCMSVAGSDSTNVKSEILLNTWDRRKHRRTPAMPQEARGAIALIRLAARRIDAHRAGTAFAKCQSRMPKPNAKCRNVGTPECRNDNGNRNHRATRYSP